MQPNQEIIEFYLRQIQAHVASAHQRICDLNGIALAPTKASELQALPVYEGEHSLLTHVSTPRRQTRISWPRVPDPSYVQAYIKKYRKPGGRIQSEVVVNVTNYCWARYYTAKELIHVMIDEDGIAASSTIEHVNDLIDSLTEDGRAFLDVAKPQTIVDEIAWLGASLYLLPPAWEPLIVKLYREMTDEFPEANAFLHIGQILRVPERVLTSRLRHLLRTPPAAT